MDIPTEAWMIASMVVSGLLAHLSRLGTATRERSNLPIPHDDD
jgi:hypothetical protein